MTAHLLVSFTREVSKPPYISINTTNTLYSTSTKFLVPGLAQNKLLLAAKTRRRQLAQNGVKRCFRCPSAYIKANPLDKRFQILEAFLMNITPSFGAKKSHKKTKKTSQKQTDQKPWLLLPNLDHQTFQPKLTQQMNSK